MAKKNVDKKYRQSVAIWKQGQRVNLEYIDRELTFLAQIRVLNDEREKLLRKERKLCADRIASA